VNSNRSSREQKKVFSFNFKTWNCVY